MLNSFKLVSPWKKNVLLQLQSGVAKNEIKIHITYKNSHSHLAIAYLSPYICLFSFSRCFLMVLHKAMIPWMVTLKSAIVLFFYSRCSIYLTWIRIRNANRSAIEYSTCRLDIHCLSLQCRKDRMRCLCVGVIFRIFSSQCCTTADESEQK